MGRKAFSFVCTVIGLATLTAVAARAPFGPQSAEPMGAAAVAATLLWGAPMASEERTRDLRPASQAPLTQFRDRERIFRSGLTSPPGATPTEGELFEKRVAIERVVFCLFPRRDIARVAASYASDADVASEWDGLSDAPRREAAFVDGLLRDLPYPTYQLTNFYCCSIV